MTWILPLEGMIFLTIVIIYLIIALIMPPILIRWNKKLINEFLQSRDIIQDQYFLNKYKALFNPQVKKSEVVLMYFLLYLFLIGTPILFWCFKPKFYVLFIFILGFLGSALFTLIFLLIINKITRKKLYDEIRRQTIIDSGH
jgi:hypothetical protein